MLPAVTETTPYDAVPLPRYMVPLCNAPPLTETTPVSTLPATVNELKFVSVTVPSASTATLPSTVK